MAYQIPRGTQDVYGDQSYKWQQLERIFREFCYLYNYDEIRTPIFEHTNVFKRENDSSDMVNKEMYTFQLENSSTSLTLRPEGTAGVIRSFVENKMYANPDLPVKLYYMGPMHRHERPQKGRLRIFNQFGVECLGNKSPYTDVECITLAFSILKALGLNDIKVTINTLGDDESRASYRAALKEYFKPHLDDLCSDCKRRYEQNPLRILDCKIDHDKEFMKNAPSMKDYLNEDFVLSFIYCPELLSLLCHKILKSYDNNFDSLPDHLKDLFYIAPALKYLSKNLQLFHPDSYVELVKFLYRYLKQNTQNGTFKEALKYTLTISIKDNDYLSLKNSLIKHGFLHHDSLTEIGKIFADLLFNEIKDNKKLISSVSSQSITRFFKKREKLFVDLFKDPNNKICTAIRRLLINDESFNDLSIIANWLNYAKTPHKALVSIFAKERYNIKELEELTEKILIKGNFICFPAITDYSNKNRFIFSTPFNHSTSVLTVLKPKPNRFNPLFIEKIKSLQCAYHLICCVNFNQSANEDIDKILSCTDFDSVQERSLAKTYLKTFKNYLKLYNPNPQIDLKALKTFYKNDASIVNSPDFYEILLRYAQKELLRYRFSPFFTHKLQLILDAVRIDTKTVLSSNENSKDNNDFNHLNKAIIDSKLQESVQVREVIGQIKAQNEENIDSEFSPEDVSSTVNKNDNIAIEKDIAAVTAPSEINETNTDQIDKALLHLIKGVHSQQRDLMDIKEFEGLCLSSGFMSLDAAVEIANEFGYDNFDEPLFELAPEENCVYITEDLLTRICSRYT